MKIIYVPITREDCINAKHGDVFYHAVLSMADGTPKRVRVTGKCKTWKTQPFDFKLPVKFGLNESLYIDPSNIGEWTRALELGDNEILCEHIFKEESDKTLVVCSNPANHYIGGHYYCDEHKLGGK